jgi:hypothetical protein
MLLIFGVIIVTKGPSDDGNTSESQPADILQPSKITESGGKVVKYLNLQSKTRL